MDKMQRNVDLCKCYQAGNSLAVCEQRFGLKRQRVKQILKDAGVWEPRIKSDRTRHVGVVVKETTKAKLTEQAEAKGMSVSQMTSDALDALVEKP